MTTRTIDAVPAGPQPAAGRLRAAVRAEWTKFRTVRGWVIGLLVAAAADRPARAAHRRGRQQRLQQSAAGPVASGAACHPHGPPGRAARR